MRWSLSILITFALAVGCGNSQFGNAADGASEGAADASSDAVADSAIVHCGSATCPLTSEVCCLDDASTCELRAGCMSPGRSRLACDDPSDCAAGQVCCLYRNADKTVSAAQCVNSVKCDRVGGDKLLCDPSRMPATCPGLQACLPFTDLIGPTFYACQ